MQLHIITTPQHPSCLFVDPVAGEAVDMEVIGVEEVVGLDEKISDVLEADAHTGRGGFQQSYGPPATVLGASTINGQN